MKGSIIRRKIEVKVDGNLILSDKVEVTFGPHYIVRIKQHSPERVSFELVATHHGVKFDASSVGEELEEAIEKIRDCFPKNLVD